MSEPERVTYTTISHIISRAFSKGRFQGLGPSRTPDLVATALLSHPKPLGDLTDRVNHLLALTAASGKSPCRRYLEDRCYGPCSKLHIPLDRLFAPLERGRDDESLSPSPRDAPPSDRGKGPRGQRAHLTAKAGDRRPARALDRRSPRREPAWAPPASGRDDGATSASDGTDGWGSAWRRGRKGSLSTSSARRRHRDAPCEERRHTRHSRSGPPSTSERAAAPVAPSWETGHDSPPARPDRRRHRTPSPCPRRTNTRRRGQRPPAKKASKASTAAAAQGLAKAKHRLVRDPRRLVSVAPGPGRGGGPPLPARRRREAPQAAASPPPAPAETRRREASPPPSGDTDESPPPEHKRARVFGGRRRSTSPAPQVPKEEAAPEAGARDGKTSRSGGLAAETLGLPLMKAVRQQDLISLRDCISRGAPLTLVDTEGFSALHRAVISGNPRITEALLNAKAPANPGPPYGPGSLLASALLLDGDQYTAEGKLQIVKNLLLAKADYHAAARGGVLPLQQAEAWSEGTPSQGCFIRILKRAAEEAAPLASSRGGARTATADGAVKRAASEPASGGGTTGPPPTRRTTDRPKSADGEERASRRRTAADSPPAGHKTEVPPSDEEGGRGGPDRPRAAKSRSRSSSHRSHVAHPAMRSQIAHRDAPAPPRGARGSADLEKRERRQGSRKDPRPWEAGQEHRSTLDQIEEALGRGSGPKEPLFRKDFRELRPILDALGALAQPPLEILRHRFFAAETADGRTFVAPAGRAPMPQGRLPTVLAAYVRPEQFSPHGSYKCKDKHRLHDDPVVPEELRGQDYYLYWIDTRVAAREGAHFNPSQQTGGRTVWITKQTLTEPSILRREPTRPYSDGRPWGVFPPRLG